MFMYILSNRFKASPDGVLWYHAHLGGLRVDGAFGLFVVHKKTPTVPHYPLLINHWLHVPFYEFMITNPYKKKNGGAIAGPGQMTYSFEHLHMEKPRAWKTMDGVRLSSMLFTRLKDISTPDFSSPDLSTTDFSTMNFSTPDFSTMNF